VLRSDCHKRRVCVQNAAVIEALIGYHARAERVAFPPNLEELLGRRRAAPAASARPSKAHPSKAHPSKARPPGPPGRLLRLGSHHHRVSDAPHGAACAPAAWSAPWPTAALEALEAIGYKDHLEERASLGSRPAAPKAERPYQRAPEAPPALSAHGLRTTWADLMVWAVVEGDSELAELVRTQ